MNLYVINHGFHYELENVARQLADQNQQLYNQLNSVEGLFKRLDYLIKILSLSDKMVFPSDFINECANEVVKMMDPSIPEEVEE